MDKVWKFLANPLGSWVRVFVSVVLGLWVADLSNVGHFVFDPAKFNVWLTAGLVAILPLVIAYVNPADTRWGRGSS